MTTLLIQCRLSRSIKGGLRMVNRRRDSHCGGRLAVALAAVVLAAPGLLAGPLTFTGTTSGSVAGAGDGFYYTDTDGSLLYGTPPGRLALASGPFSATSGQLFSLGTFTYFNNFSANDPSAAVLSVQMAFTAGSLT